MGRGQCALGCLAKLTHMEILPTPNFWNGKRVFLTGHTGFKGAWMCEMLLSLGARVYGFSLRPDTDPSLFKELDLEHRIARHETGNICNADVLSQALANAQPDVVLHMAAQPIVSVGYSDPVGTFATNVMGTVNVLEAVRSHCGDIPVVVVSSDKCYDNSGLGRSFVEDDALGGADPYSASKAGTEIVCGSYRASFFSQAGSARLASVRAGNVIGGGDWSTDRLVPDLIRGFSAQQPVTIRRPEATRPWQHVLEPLNGYLICAEAVDQERSHARPWNFGPRAGDVHSVAEVAEIAQSTWKGPTDLHINTATQTFKEAETLAIDSNAARSVLGWKTGLDFTRTVEWTVAWYEAYYSNPKAVRNITETQLQEYLDLLKRSRA